MKPILLLNAALVLTLCVGCTRNRDTDKQVRTDATDTTTTATTDTSTTTQPGVTVTDTTTQPGATGFSNTTNTTDVKRDTAAAGANANTDAAPNINTGITPGNEMGAISKGSGHIEKDFSANMQKRVSSLDYRIGQLKSRANQRSGDRKVDLIQIDQKRSDLSSMLTDLEKRNTQGGDWEATKVNLAKAVGSLESELSRAEKKLK
ncbi:MAG: hypothetical protein SGI74_14645 [Oligoflexia bacterium]|nr:hypothetical protein [Oligoflexia bacterium]